MAVRVLHVVPAVAARYGGPSVVALRACQALLEAGHRVQIATTDADGAGHLDVPLVEPFEFEGVPAIFFRRTGGERYKWSPALARWLRTAAREFDVIDVHAVFSHSSVAAGRAACGAGVPYVVRPHGALDPWSLGRKAWRKRLLLTAGVGRLLRHAAAIQFTTAEEERLAKDALPWLGPGAVVPLGVDDEWFEGEPSPATPRYVLTLSRLDAKKGLELLIDTFHDLVRGQAATDWTLVIGGDGSPDYVRQLRARAGSGPGASRIRFTGWVGGSEKRDLVRGASLLASPSLQENFGLSVAEAMAAGVPVFVSPGVNLAPEIADAGAGWVVERDARRMRDGLADALASDDEIARRGRAARGLAQRYRWSAHARQLVELYERVRRGGVR